jgi:hypothetical protein
MRCYAEMGIGNPTFLSTEIECGVCEWRIPRLVVSRVESIYLRVWIGRIVFILDSKEGFKYQRKGYCVYKCVLGLVGRVTLGQRP